MEVPRGALHAKPGGAGRLASWRERFANGLSMFRLALGVPYIS